MSLSYPRFLLSASFTHCLVDLVFVVEQFDHVFRLPQHVQEPDLSFELDLIATWFAEVDDLIRTNITKTEVKEVNCIYTFRAERFLFSSKTS